MKENKSNGNVRVTAGFILIMIALGASDSLRGLFAPIFREHYQLNNLWLSMIVTVSYMGNLVFLLAGGRLMDRYKKKHVFLAVLSIWLLSLVLYLLTDQYICLLIGMFFSMGASTLLNTAVNLMTPMFFPLMQGFMVNLFFFTQGIGTSASQSLIGRYAEGYGHWNYVNGILLILGLLSFLLLAGVKVPEHEKSKGSERKAGEVVKNPSFILLILLFGFYFIAEHGILNWLVSYCQEVFEMPVSKASAYLSVFFGGMMIGRLLLAPAVQKLGALKSITVFGGIGAVLFIAGILAGSRGIWLLSISGIFISILYPTMVLLIQKLYPEGQAATAAGTVISIATLFDIAFNSLFGILADRAGYRITFLILPVCMAGFYGCSLWLSRAARKKEEMA